MRVEDIILKSIDKCLEKAAPEQKRTYLWTKAVIKYPDIEEFIKEIRNAEQGVGKVSLQTIDKAIEFVSSNFKLQTEFLCISEDSKRELIKLEEIRLEAVKTTIKRTLNYLGWI